MRLAWFLAGCTIVAGGMALMGLPATASFVAVGEDGQVMTSPTGIDWTSQSSGTTSDLYGIAYGNGKLVAVGEAGRILTSRDGVAWETQCPAGLGSGCQTNTLRAVTYAASQWIAVGDSSTILTSPNGSDWTAQSSNGTNGQFLAIAYGSNQWGIAGRMPDPCLPTCSSDKLILIFSATGSSWSPSPLTGSKNYWFNGLAYSATHWAGVGASSGGSRLDHGVAPLTSSPSSGGSLSSSGSDCHAAVHDGAKFVVSCGTTIYTTTGASPWTWTPYTGTNTRALAQDGQRWVAVGPNGTASTSPPNAQSWTSRTTGTSDDLNAITAMPNVAPVNRFNAATYPGGVSGNAAQTMTQDTTLTFNTANSNRLAVWDPDGIGNSTYRVTAAVTYGRISLSATTGLNFSCSAGIPVAGLPACSGNGTANTAMTFDGKMTDINTALNGLTYAPPLGTCSLPDAVLTIRTHDKGNHGTGGDLVDTDTVTIAITCVAASCTPNPTIIAPGGTTTVTGFAGSHNYSWTAAGPATWPGSPIAQGGKTFNVSWTGSGSHLVTVTDLGRPGQSSTCSVTVVAQLTCSATPAAIVAGSATTFTAGGPPGPYSWSFPNGSPTSGTGTSISVTHASPGNKTAAISTSSPAQSATCPLAVREPISCTATTAWIFADQTATFTAAGGTAIYAWSSIGTPASATGGILTVQFATNGTKTVTLDDAGPPTQTTTCQVTVYNPASCANAHGNVGFPIPISVSNGTGAYTWMAPLGSPTNGTGPTFAPSYPKPGSYIVLVTSGGRTSSCTVTVNPSKEYPGSENGLSGRGHVNPTAHIVQIQPPCGTWTTTLVGLGSTDADGAVSQWSWHFSDGTQAEGGTVSKEFPGPGLHLALLIVEDDEGLTDMDVHFFALTECQYPNIVEPAPGQSRAAQTCIDSALGSACANPLPPPSRQHRQNRTFEQDKDDPDLDGPPANQDKPHQSSSRDGLEGKTEAEAITQPVWWTVAGITGLALACFMAGILFVAGRKRTRDRQATTNLPSPKKIEIERGSLVVEQA